WKAKAKELVAEHTTHKAEGAIAISQKPSELGRAMKQATKQWSDDLKWLAMMNAHAMFVIVSGSSDPAVAKHNVMLCGSQAMTDWAKGYLPLQSAFLSTIHAHIVMALGMPLLMSACSQPKDMHKMWKEIKDAL